MGVQVGSLGRHEPRDQWKQLLPLETGLRAARLLLSSSVFFFLGGGGKLSELTGFRA